MSARARLPAPDPLHGALVKIPLPGRAGALDGFWHPGHRRHDTLLVFLHGMWGNFYRSALKWASLRLAPEFGMDALSFNNRGTGHATAFERFPHCLADLESVRRWARASGYRRIVWVGHSTGCQKAVHYLARRKPADTAALVLLAPADDLAIVRRESGPRYASMVRHARARALAGGPDADRPEPIRPSGKTAPPSSGVTTGARRGRPGRGRRKTRPRRSRSSGRCWTRARGRCATRATAGE